MKNDVLALLAATLGGVVGYFAFLWIAGQGFYAIMLPGILVGIFASFFKSKSTAVCAICGCLALGFGLFAEWRFAPFVGDDSLRYFLSHLHQLRPITLLMIGAGVLMGFLVPFRSRKEPVKA
jgi:hypothetical protein